MTTAAGAVPNFVLRPEKRLQKAFGDAGALAMVDFPFPTTGSPTSNAKRGGIGAACSAC
jgi:hypothetical protein